MARPLQPRHNLGNPNHPSSCSPEVIDNHHSNTTSRKRRKLEGGRLNYSKCPACRKNHEKCTPTERQWPTRCSRCIDRDLECSPPEKRKAGGFKRCKVKHTENLDAGQDEAEGPEPNSKAWYEAQLALRDAELKSLRMAQPHVCTEEHLTSSHTAKAIIDYLHEERPQSELRKYIVTNFETPHNMAAVDDADIQRTAETLSTILQRMQNMDSETKLNVVHDLINQMFHSGGWYRLDMLMDIFPDEVNAWRDPESNTLLLSFNYNLYGLDQEATAAVLRVLSTLDVNARDSYGNTALMIAIHHGQFDLLRALLDVPSLDPNLKDRSGRTALYRAAESGRADCTRLLLSHPDTDVNLKDVLSEQTPLEAAVLYGRTDIMELLLTCPTLALHAESKWRVLNGAVLRGRTEGIQLLLSQPGFDINVVNEDAETLLMSAVSSNSPDVVRLLMSYPAIRPNAKNRNGSTALKKAVLHGSIEDVKILLSYPKIDVNKQDVRGRTALWWAAWDDCAEAVKALLKHGEININIADDEGDLPIHVAVDRQNVAVANAILGSTSAQCDRANHNGLTPFHLATNKLTYYPNDPWLQALVERMKPYALG